MSGIHILKGHRVHLQNVAYLIGSGEPISIWVLIVSKQWGASEGFWVLIVSRLCFRKIYPVTKEKVLGVKETV